MRLTIRYRKVNVLPINNIIRYNSNIKKMIKEGSDVAMTSINQNKMINDLKELYKEMERRKYNIRWIGIGCILFVGYIFYGAITDWFTDQAADVTSKYLENPKFKKDIIIFVEQTINDLVESPKVQTDITNLLHNSISRLSNDPDIQNKLESLFIQIFNSEKIKNSGADLTKDVIMQIINSPKYDSVRKEAVNYIIKEMIHIINDDELQKTVGIASWNAFKVWFGIRVDKDKVSNESQIHQFDQPENYIGNTIHITEQKI